MSRDRKSDADRTLTERRLGRKLGPNEIVHHGDEDKSNNTPGNLSVEGRAAHTRRHNKTRTLGKLRKALTMANRKEKLY